MLRIEMLPARHGDCIWIEYGQASQPHRILIDGGPAFAYPALRARIKEVPENKRNLDLLVVTHIDGDHIEGIIKLLGDSEINLRMDDLWYNGYRQLTSAEDFSFGALQGEYLTALIEARGLPWNKMFDGGPIMTTGTDADLPTYELPDGCRLTILSPTPIQTGKLRNAWEVELSKAGLEPDSPEEAMERLKASKLRPDFDFAAAPRSVEQLAALPYKEDSAVANGSSIAFLLEYQSTRCLLAGDANPGVLEIAVKKLIRQEGGTKLKIDVFKLPHHGSKHNLSPTLLNLLDCQHFLVSSDGGYFDHPDPEAISRLVTHSAGQPKAYFNYLSERNEMWADPELMERHGYQALFPPRDTPGMLIEF